MTPLDFLRALYAPYAEQAAALKLSVEVRAFPPEWDTDRAKAVAEHRLRAPRNWFRLTDADYERATEFAGRIAPTWDAYMGVLPRTRGGGKAEHLRLAAYLWADMDAGSETVVEAAALLKAQVAALGLPSPALMVRSGGGLHAYWRLSSPVALATRDEQERLRRVLMRLTRAIGGDLDKAHACPKATDCARILRLPGTFNLKNPDLPRPVYLLRCDANPETRPLVWWEANLPALPLPPRRNYSPPSRSGGSGGGGGKELTDRLVDWLTSPAHDGEKHYRLVDVAVYLRKRDQPADVVRALLVQKAANSGVAAYDLVQQRHIDNIIAWTFDHVQPDYQTA
jgi:hypothetical protein